MIITFDEWRSVKTPKWESWRRKCAHARVTRMRTHLVLALISVSWTVLAKYTSELFVQLVLQNENWLPEQSSLNYVRHLLIQTCAKIPCTSKLLRNNITAVDNLYALINLSNSIHAFTKTLFCEVSFINDSMYISIKLSIELPETTDLKFDQNNSLTTLPNAISFWNDSFKHHCRPQGPSFLLVTFSRVTLEARTLNVQTRVVWSCRVHMRSAGVLGVLKNRYVKCHVTGTKEMSLYQHFLLVMGLRVNRSKSKTGSFLNFILGLRQTALEKSVDNM